MVFSILYPQIRIHNHFKKNFFCHIGSTLILNVKDNYSHLNIFVREHTQKSNRFPLVAAERPVARDVAGNNALRPVMAQPILPGHKKKLRDNCTEVLAGKDLFAIFALAIEASSIQSYLMVR